MTVICEIRVLTDVPLAVWRNISFSKHVVVVPIKKLTNHLHNIGPCPKLGPAMWASTFCSVEGIIQHRKYVYVDKNKVDLRIKIERIICS